MALELASDELLAKGTRLLGVRAVIAESFERIHRSNLIGMGVLPLQFPAGETAESLKLTGAETFTITGVEQLNFSFSGESWIEVRDASGTTTGMTVATPAVAKQATSMLRAREPAADCSCAARMAITSRMVPKTMPPKTMAVPRSGSSSCNGTATAAMSAVWIQAARGRWSKASRAAAWPR